MLLRFASTLSVVEFRPSAFVLPFTECNLAFSVKLLFRSLQFRMCFGQPRRPNAKAPQPFRIATAKLCFGFIALYSRSGTRRHPGAQELCLESQSGSPWQFGDNSVFGALLCAQLSLLFIRPVSSQSRRARGPQRAQSSVPEPARHSLAVRILRPAT